MIRLTDFTTLMFDCYGTLIDWERGILAELRPFATRHGIQVSDGGLLEAFGAVERECETEMPSLAYPLLLAEVLRRLGARWGVTAGPDETEAFGASVGRWPIFADSPASLQYLKRFYRLVILSNVDRASFVRSNEKLGADFDRVITSEDVGCYKPDPRSFAYALDDIQRHLGAGKSDILHIGQSLFHDIAPAKAAGLRTAWIDRRKGLEGWGATPPPPGWMETTQPDFEASSLAEFVALHQEHLRHEKA